MQRLRISVSKLASFKYFQDNEYATEEKLITDLTTRTYSTRMEVGTYCHSVIENIIKKSADPFNTLHLQDQVKSGFNKVAESVNTPELTCEASLIKPIIVSVDGESYEVQVSARADGIAGKTGIEYKTRLHTMRDGYLCVRRNVESLQAVNDMFTNPGENIRQNVVALEVGVANKSQTIKLEGNRLHAYNAQGNKIEDESGVFVNLISTISTDKLTAKIDSLDLEGYEKYKDSFQAQAYMWMYELDTVNFNILDIFVKESHYSLVDQAVANKEDAISNAQTVMVNAQLLSINSFTVENRHIDITSVLQDFIFFLKRKNLLYLFDAHTKEKEAAINKAIDNIDLNSIINSTL